MMVIKAEDFINFLLRIQHPAGNYEQVIVPCKTDSGTKSFKKIENTNKTDIVLDSCRTSTPPKYLFYFPRERVYPARNKFPKRIIAGLKACDLKSLELLDKALLNGGFREPVYSGWRENTTIISFDCTEICSTCSCNLFGGKPYAEKGGYDLNISRIDDSYFITVGSTKGEELLQLIYKEIECSEARPDDKEKLNLARQKMYSLIEEQNSNYNFNGELSELKDRPAFEWDEKSKECIGCGACTNVCPTCYCLILNDDSLKSQFVKTRSFDSCQWYGYARVAGGGTPRPKMHQRFRNRYLCKLDYMNSNFNMPGCTGCGRCTEACAAGIDFRKVVKELSSKNVNEEFQQERV